MRTRALVAASVLVLGLGAAACGSSSGDSGTSGSTSGSTAASTGSAAPATTAADSGVELAKAEVAKYKANPAVDIKPLPKPAPKNLTVALVGCTVTACYPHGQDEAAKALGWTSKNYDYDITKGPSDFVAAVQRAIASKPDAISMILIYPPDLIKNELAQAKKEGIILLAYGPATDGPPPPFDACLQCNPANEGTGRLMADIAIADAGGPTSIGITRDKTISSHVSVNDGVKEELQRVAPATKTQFIDISFTKPPEANAASIVSFLQRNPDVKYVTMPVPDLMAGLPQALRAAGLADKVKLLNIAPANGDQVMQVKDGDLFAWAAHDGGAFMWRGIDTIARIKEKAEFDPAPPGSIRAIMADNAEPSMADAPNYKATFKQAWGVN